MSNSERLLVVLRVGAAARGVIAARSVIWSICTVFGMSHLPIIIFMLNVVVVRKGGESFLCTRFCGLIAGACARGA